MLLYRHTHTGVRTKAALVAQHHRVARSSGVIGRVYGSIYWVLHCSGHTKHKAHPAIIPGIRRSCSPFPRIASPFR